MENKRTNLITRFEQSDEGNETLSYPLKCSINSEMESLIIQIVHMPLYFISQPLCNKLHGH